MKLLNAATVFVSAFLLFQIQPIIAKYILPWYGGSQAVWTVCLLFFQLALLAGYAYGHMLRKIPDGRVQAGVHVTLLAVSLLTLPIAPAATWRVAGGGDPTWQILGLLSATIGLPYVLLAATAPLVLSWLSASGAPTPYRYYALSNVGSLLALLTFPFVVEPAISRSEQASMWSWGMGLAAVLAGGSALLSLTPAGKSRSRGNAPSRGNPPRQGPRSAAGATLLFWIGLPALAVVFLLATTNRLVQELVAIPFLWILPLSIYLLTFILTFDSTRWYRRAPFLGVIAASYAGILWLHFLQEDPPLVVSVLLSTAALFAGCMICHGELVALKPPPARLTGFYLSVAAGGALGGMFVALAAPAIFNDYTEYPLSLALVPVAWIAVRRWGGPGEKAGGDPLRWPLAAGGALAAAVFGAVLLAGRAGDESVIERRRNFYGVLTVAEYDHPGSKGFHRTMRHGRILHGLQYLHPDYERMPTAYFTGKSGAGIALANFPRQPGRGLKIGVIGLGAGTLAAWTLPGDTIRFYEINPAVEDLARKDFTFLAKAHGTVEVVIADGRLALERESPQQFDILVLDAFNNDSPPLHLLTAESFVTYLRHLRPDGVVAMHITSKYINFIPVVSALAGRYRLPWTTVIDYNREDEFLRTLSFWALLTRNRELQDNPALLSASSQPEIARPVRLWTDDFASLFEIIEW